MVNLSVSSDKYNKILVRGVNWIGDAVMTMPALRALKKANPASAITLLVKPWVSPLFERDPNITEMLLYTDDYRGIYGRFRLANKLKGYGFDAAILFQNAFDAAFLSFISGIPERIGYGRDGRSVLLTKAVPYDEHAKGLHHVDYYMNLLEKAGFSAVKTMPWLFVSVSERIKARDKLKELRPPVVAINPGATYGSSKRWPPGHFADVAKRVLDEINGSIIVLGGPTEKGIAEEIIHLIGSGVDSSHFKSQVQNVAGKTSLRELMALISECDVLVTNDSGPMHIGYAAGTPVVAIFGSTSPELTGPVGYENAVIRPSVECSPCFDRECRKGNLRCMDTILPDEIFQAVKKFIKSKRAVFFDRDGTLCRDAHYLDKMEDFNILPGLGKLRELKKAGYLLIGVTNQSGIARGLVAEDFVEQVNSVFINSYGFDAFYYCPHHPDEGCSCRKPEPALLFQARRDFDVDLKKSFVVGDRELDMLLAKAVGAKGILVRTGKEVFAPSADFVAEDLEQVVETILRQ